MLTTRDVVSVCDRGRQNVESSPKTTSPPKEAQRGTKGDEGIGVCKKILQI